MAPLLIAKCCFWKVSSKPPIRVLRSDPAYTSQNIAPVFLFIVNTDKPILFSLDVFIVYKSYSLPKPLNKKSVTRCVDATLSYLILPLFVLRVKDIFLFLSSATIFKACFTILANLRCTLFIFLILSCVSSLDVGW